MKTFGIFIFLLFLAFFSCGQHQPCATAKGDTLIRSLICASDFTYLAGKPLSSKYARVKSLKALYRLEDRQLYFIPSAKYQYHYGYCVDWFQDSLDLQTFNDRNYHLHPERKYLLFNFNYYQDLKRYVVELFPGEEAKPDLIKEMLQTLSIRTPVDFELAVLDNNTLLSQPGTIPASYKLISPEEIYGQQSFECLKSGLAYGYLEKVSAKDLGKTKLPQHSILVLDNLPLFLPWTEAVITDVFQTPLSHINVLCSNRGIPNCSWKGAWSSDKINTYLHSLVKVRIQEDGVQFYPATLEEAQKHWAKHALPDSLIALDTNYTYRKLISIEELRTLSIAVAGAKAYNFSQLSLIKTEDKTPIQIPENAFAIPFYYYQQHLQTNGLLPLVDSVMALPKDADPTKIKASLKKLRNAIETAHLDSKLLHMVHTQMQKNKQFKYYRFRSSTNAEDIEGFNGAGLYESHTGSRHDNRKKVQDAIRKVWSSLWNYSAYMEREYFHIDHRTVAMGILVHRSFGNDLANGVAVTRHLYRTGYPAYTLNVQAGETSVVGAPDSITASQYLVLFRKDNSYALDYITFSSISANKQVLTDPQLKQLVSYLRAIKKYFYNKQSSNIYYYDYGLDIEFKVDAQSKKIYIKQVRPYK